MAAKPKAKKKVSQEVLDRLAAGRAKMMANRAKASPAKAKTKATPSKAKAEPKAKARKVGTVKVVGGGESRLDPGSKARKKKRKTPKAPKGKVNARAKRQSGLTSGGLKTGKLRTGKLTSGGLDDNAGGYGSGKMGEMIKAGRVSGMLTPSLARTGLYGDRAGF